MFRMDHGQNRRRILWLNAGHSLPRRRPVYTARPELRVRNGADQVGSRNDLLIGLDEHLTIDRHIHIGILGKAQVGATMPLADALAKTYERSRGQTESITVKLQHDAVAFIRLYPEGIGRTIGPDTFRTRVQIHDLAFDRTSRRIGPEAADANSYHVSFTLHDALVSRLYRHNLAIDRTHDAKSDGRYLSQRVAEQQVHEDQHDSGHQQVPWFVRADDEDAGRRHEHHGQNALFGDEWIASTLHSRIPLYTNDHGPSPAFAAESTGPRHRGHMNGQKRLECAPHRLKVLRSMRFSQFGLTTLKEVPAEAEIVSHKLMLRAGLIRRLASGLFTWMPIGLRILRKVEAVVRKEMDRAGALELLMPAVQPAELWEESGRWDQYGPLLLRMQDRHERDFCFGPTHEEVITDIARRELRSYKQLPVNFYQIQTKFRDEIRPRFGVMRSREFIMKDAYSFDIDHAGLQASYEKMHAAYTAIFERLGLKFRVVDADSGEIGGSRSQEFHVLADSGEDAIAYSDADDYASNIETAATVAPQGTRPGARQSLEKVATPGIKTIEALCEFLNVTPSQTLKTLIVDGTDGPIALALRGDHELNSVKAQKITGVASPLTMASPEVVRDVTGCAPGFAGPIGLEIPVFYDHATAAMSDFVCGANETDMHLRGVNFDRDVDSAETFDMRNVVVGDPTPGGTGTLSIARGIEVGHIFQLGDKYSLAMGATVQDPEGKNRPMAMGCYGIGITRIVGAAIEQNHDENGIIWPDPLAPFDVVLVPINMQRSDAVREAAEALYAELTEKGFDVLFDDRDARPGVKFADAELIGIPHRLVISDRNLAAGELEYRHRRDVESRNLKREEALKVLEESDISY